MRMLPGLLLAAWLLASCSTPATPTPFPANLPANIAPASKAGAGRSTPLLAGDVAPAFSFTNANGTITNLSDLQGKIVIVNFWATWCTPCRNEMPALQQIADEYDDRVVVIGVNKLEEVDKLVAFKQELGLRFLLVANPEGDISERYAVRNLPTTFFIKPDGVIGDWKLGGVTYEEARAVIQQLEKQ